MVPGEPIVCRTARVLIASKTLPPALRTIVAPFKSSATAQLGDRGGNATQALIDAQDVVRV